ncbi:NusG domain II-containing protein [Ruminococcus sp.]
MTKGVKIIGAVVLLMLAAAIVAVMLNFRTSDNTHIVILQNNKVIYSLDLSKEKDRSFRIESPDGGWNEVKIENGKICIADADCPDQTCVHTGVLRSEGVPIVCLPHKLVIRFSDEESS